MKIGTDALLLGAWARVKDSVHVVDLGTGSGIVALMAAQRAEHAQVIGVELEPKAARQAAENFQSSPFQARMHVVHADARAWSDDPQNREAFDVVLSNPPFFQNKPKSPHFERNLARHDDALPLPELMKAAYQLLKPGGTFQMVWPADRWPDAERESEAHGFLLLEKLTIRGAVHREPSRLLLHWVKPQAHEALGMRPDASLREMTIEEGLRENGMPLLSLDYIQLLSPYRDL